LKIAIGAIALLLASGTLAAHDGPTDDEGSLVTGKRFKIFTAEHQAITKSGNVVTIQSIFKIDLETGTVWRYRQGVDQKGKRFEEFFEVPNQ
jgi:hypothetical protein